jgi:hypothetical protein
MVSGLPVKRGKLSGAVRRNIFRLPQPQLQHYLLGEISSWFTSAVLSPGGPLEYLSALKTTEIPRPILLSTSQNPWG